MTAPIVAVDIETDGLHPGRRVWEVAMIRRDEQGERETSFFVGLDLKNSDPYGLQVGGYWDRHPSGRKISGKPPAPSDLGNLPLSKHEAASTVMRWTFGAHLIGVNPAFDADTLAGLLRAEGYMAAWHYHLLDVAALAYGYLHGIARFDGHECTAVVRTWSEETAFGLPELPWRSDELSQACGVEPPGDDRRTAMADARWALRWYDKLTGGPA